MVSSRNSLCLCILRIICLSLLWSLGMSCTRNIGNLMWETNPSVADWVESASIIIIGPSFYGIYEKKPNFLWPLMILIVIGTPVCLIMLGLKGYYDDPIIIILTIVVLAYESCLVMVFIALRQQVKEKKQQQQPTMIV